MGIISHKRCESRLDNKAALRLQLSNRFSFDHSVTFNDRSIVHESIKCDSGPGTMHSQRMVEVMQ